MILTAKNKMYLGGNMTNSFINSISNLTYTENNALTHQSSESKIVDLFFHGGAIRKSRPHDIVKYFNEAFNEDADLTLKVLFYLRDIRGGQGERNIFRIAIKDFILNHYEWVNEENLLLIPEYGRWDDLIYLVEEPNGNPTQIKINNLIGVILKNQIKNDLLSIEKDNLNISLLGKWMPSINTSSKTTRKQGRLICELLKMSEKEYRQTLSKLRKMLNIVETKISNGDYNNIDYSKLPSLAAIKYVNAFHRHDDERYSQYLNDLANNKKGVKINTSTLYPADIVHKVLRLCKSDDTMEQAWKNLPDYVDNLSGLVVADTSGSMSGTPIEVCLSLAVYIAERNKNEAFKDYFITFSANPQLQKIEGNTLHEKIHNLEDAEWNMNTNLQRVFDLVLDRAKAKNVPQEDMPRALIIISDMEFDDACSDKTNFEVIKERYNNSGYNMPKLIFWNVDSRHNQCPITINDNGVYLVSGYSPIIMKQVLMNMNSEAGVLEFVKQTVNTERYSKIKY